MLCYYVVNSMIYLYHWVPENLRGDILFPLNVLKDRYPDIYAEHAEKYSWRPHIMEQKIPILNCLWNDVLHFSVVHPNLVKQALIEAGDTRPFNLELFEVDPHLLSPENTIVFLHKELDITQKMNEENFASYNPDQLQEYAIISERTKKYYREMFASNKEPLLYSGVPHVLYKGSLNISGLKIIKV